MAKDYHGAKIALLYENKIVVYLRDNKPDLRFAGLWDLPGGGREGDETPYECIRREVFEETNIDLTPDQVVWQREYPAMHDTAQRSFFMVARVREEQINNMRFSEEGREWQLITVEKYLALDGAVPDLKVRLRHYLTSHLGDPDDDFLLKSPPKPKQK